jgi:hypothetical protein
MPAKLSHATFVERIASLFDNTVEVIGPYEGRHKLVRVRCRTCGHEWSPYATNILSGAGCLGCTFARKVKPDAEVRRKIEAHGLVLVVGTYTGMLKPLQVRCRACDHSWSGRPHDLRDGHGCPRCAGKLLDHATVVERIKQRHSGRIIVLGEFDGVREPIRVQCAACNLVWSPSANALMQGSGCPTCNRQGFDPAKPALLYCCKFPHPDKLHTLYKIGITNRSVIERYALEWGRMRLVRDIMFKTGEQARSAEAKLIRANQHLRYHGPTGFSFTDAEVFVRDVTA